MKQYSIDMEISKLDSTQSKVYHYLYADSGFELGFGKAGEYSGHSHLFFFDLIYSLSLISTSNSLGEKLKGNLILAQPRSFMGDVITENFFFLKFCTSPDKVILPDKSIKVLHEGVIEAFDKNVTREISWFKSNTSNPSSVILTLKTGILKLKIGEMEFFINK